MMTGVLRLGGYVCDGLLGPGGVTETYRTRDPDAPSYGFALKLLRPDRGGQDPEVAARFIQAALDLAAVSSPGIGRVLDVSTAHDEIFVLSELVEGLDLRRMREAADASGAGIDPQVVASAGAEIARGLAFLHGQPVPLMHGALSPGNVVLTPTGGVVLLDAGLGAAIRNLTDNPVDKWLFVAPEVLAGGTPTVASDLYSLGAVLFYLLSGQPPVPVDSREELVAALRTNVVVVPATPSWLAQIVEQLMSPSPAGRPTSAADAAVLLAGGNLLRSRLAAWMTQASSPAPTAGGAKPVDLSQMGLVKLASAFADPSRAENLPAVSAELVAVSAQMLSVSPEMLAPPADDLATLPAPDASVMDIAAVIRAAQEPVSAGPRVSVRTPTPAHLTPVPRTPAPVLSAPPAPQRRATRDAPIVTPPSEDKAWPRAAAPTPVKGVPIPPTATPVWQPPAGERRTGTRRPTQSAAVRSHPWRSVALASVTVMGMALLALSFLNGRGRPTENPRVSTTPAVAPVMTVVPVAAMAPQVVPKASVVSTPPGELKIVTSPPGATIWVDGVDKGKSPQAMKGMAGVHRVVLTKPGFRMLRETVDVSEGGFLQRTLPPASANFGGNITLSVLCQTKSQYPVFVDGRDTGILCPAEGLKITPGNHLIGVFVIPQNKIWSFEREILDGPAPQRVSFSY